MFLSDNEEQLEATVAEFGILKEGPCVMFRLVVDEDGDLEGNLFVNSASVHMLREAQKAFVIKMEETIQSIERGDHLNE